MNDSKSNKKIEVEVRGILSEEQYQSLVKKLKQKADSYEQDGKISYFFVTIDRILKVTDEISKNRAKITLKLGDETENILEEIEIPIARDEVGNAVNMFKHLGFTKINRVEQKRINFNYEGVIISLKYSDDWGYHFEAEALCESEKEGKNTKIVLEKICQNLGIIPMTGEEIRRKIEEINTRHGLI